ncbi:MAG TPA: helix-turn-helix domain-containing protein [Acidimicrobiia bacterium]|nr:helix-turn-helix domain-containing protein [Acidimicrobiia bacterium]
METEHHEVVVAAFDGLQLLDLAGPVEVLRTATRLGASPPYRTVIATPEGRPVRSESGVAVGADVSLADLARSRDRVDTLVVVGGEGTRTAAQNRSFLADLAAVAGRAPRVTSVCSGAWLLAAAGLLDGYEATTHWASCDAMAERFAGVQVRPDRIYVRDRDRWTSAGVTAGVDLFLAIVRADHGAELAHQAAGWLVVFVQRPGGQSQFSAQLRAQRAATTSIADLQASLGDHLDENLGVGTLAARVGMSPRTFARVFRRETGTTPAVFVEELRVETARRLLETTDLTVAAVARRVGLKHAETLHRAFHRRLGTTPDRYRQHFRRRAS